MGKRQAFLEGGGDHDDTQEIMSFRGNSTYFLEQAQDRIIMIYIKEDRHTRKGEAKSKVENVCSWSMGKTILRISIKLILPQTESTNRKTIFKCRNIMMIQSHQQVYKL